MVLRGPRAARLAVREGLRARQRGVQIPGAQRVTRPAAQLGFQRHGLRQLSGVQQVLGPQATQFGLPLPADQRGCHVQRSPGLLGLHGIQRQPDLAQRALQRVRQGVLGAGLVVAARQPQRVPGQGVQGGRPVRARQPGEAAVHQRHAPLRQPDPTPARQECGRPRRVPRQQVRRQRPAQPPGPLEERRAARRDLPRLRRGQQAAQVRAQQRMRPVRVLARPGQERAAARQRLQQRPRARLVQRVLQQRRDQFLEHAAARQQPPQRRIERPQHLLREVREQRPQRRVPALQVRQVRQRHAALRRRLRQETRRDRPALGHRVRRADLRARQGQALRREQRRDLGRGERQFRRREPRRVPRHLQPRQFRQVQRGA